MNTLTKIAAVAAFAAAPAFAQDAEMCKTFAETAYLGAEAGNAMEPLTSIELIAASQFSQDEMYYRLYMSVYLAGYSAGLLGATPEDAAVEFFAGCIGEPV